MENKKNKQYKAFTLAEVLITLSILGVVAAISIPGIIGHYKKTYTETRLKQAYSILENALEIAKVEHGSFGAMIEKTIASSTVQIEKNEFFGENYLRPYLNVRSACYNPSSCKIFVASPIKNGSATEVQDRNFVLNLDGSKNTGTMYSYIPSWYQMELANGILIGVAWVFDFREQVIFVVDINGKSGPNRIGYDIFYFSIWSSSGCEGCLNAKGDGVYAGTYLYAVESAAENAATCSGAGYGCSVLIKRNGWKIPNDYPVKF